MEYRLSWSYRQRWGTDSSVGVQQQRWSTDSVGVQTALEYRQRWSYRQCWSADNVGVTDSVAAKGLSAVISIKERRHKQL